MTDRRAGFTLLELSLAMTALAMVVAICYGAFHLGIRAVERGEVAVVTEQRLRVASDVLIRQIKSAVPYAARNRDEDVYPYFVGTTTSLTFVTAAAQQGGGGLVRVVYRLEEDPTRLVLEESPFFSPDSLGRDPVDKPGRTSAVLIDGFRTLTFEYLYNDGADTEWRPAWDGLVDEMMPAAVRIVITGMPGLDLDSWGQEIPLMVTAYGESTGEVDEDEVQTANEEGSEGTTDSGGKGAGFGNDGGGEGGDEGGDE
jgi:prepilin-type N-terminal cleavage/methylation domain-containing protein